MLIGIMTASTDGLVQSATSTLFVYRPSETRSLAPMSRLDWVSQSLLHRVNASFSCDDRNALARYSALIPFLKIDHSCKI